MAPWYGSPQRSQNGCSMKRTVARHPAQMKPSAGVAGAWPQSWHSSGYKKPNPAFNQLFTDSAKAPGGGMALTLKHEPVFTQARSNSFKAFAVANSPVAC